MLFSIHGMAAAFTGIDALQIDREESKLLADAVVEVSQHYNVNVDPKTTAWLGLFGALGAVYGSRVGAIKLGKKMKVAQKNDGEIKPNPMGAGGNNVVQMGANGFPLNLPVVNAG